MNDATLKRAFVALPVPRTATRFLQDMTQSLRHALNQLEKNQNTPTPRTIWEDPANYHITLKYMGDITSDQADILERITRETAHRTPAFKLTLTTLELFRTDAQSALVLKSKPSGRSQTLWNINRELEEKLNTAGLRPSDFDFTPHITIAKTDRGDTPAPPAWPLSLPVPNPPTWTQTSVTLFSSGATKNNRRYHQVNSWALKG